MLQINVRGRVKYSTHWSLCEQAMIIACRGKLTAAQILRLMSQSLASAANRSGARDKLLLSEQGENVLYLLTSKHGSIIPTLVEMGQLLPSDVVMTYPFAAWSMEWDEDMFDLPVYSSIGCLATSFWDGQLAAEIVDAIGAMNDQAPAHEGVRARYYRMSQDLAKMASAVEVEFKNFSPSDPECLEDASVFAKGILVSTEAQDPTYSLLENWVKRRLKSNVLPAFQTPSKDWPDCAQALFYSLGNTESPTPVTSDV